MEADLLHTDSGHVYSFGGGHYGQLGCGELKVSSSSSALSKKQCILCTLSTSSSLTPCVWCSQL